jgi:acyl-[acyl-carrier-protein]-phospholipid O-acyltransferase/long-chain-fatty-acid--[acyl-carrier-protein] ligase
MPSETPAASAPPSGGGAARLGAGFHAFVATQFLGAFNDNLFKQLVLFLAASMLFPGQDVQGLAMAVFAIPFLLFSGLAGELSERFSKQRIMVLMKWAEVAIMAFGVLAFHLQNWTLLLATLFIMGTQSAFFGPPKYGAIPEFVRPVQLIRANGYVTMTTFVAVLIGGGLAGPILDTLGDQMWALGAICTGLAVVGTMTAKRIPALAPTDPKRTIHKNPFRDLYDTAKDVSAKPGVLPLLALNSAFYFNAAVIQLAIIGLGGPGYLDIGAGEKKQLSFVVATMSAAVGLGAMIAPKLARRFAPGKLAAVAALLMVFGQLGFNGVGTLLDRQSGALVLMHLTALWVGVFGAIVVVPVVAFLQYLPDEGSRGRTFGATNFANWVAIFLAAAFFQVLMLPDVQVSPAVAQTISGLVMLTVLAFGRKSILQTRIQ